LEPPFQFTDIVFSPDGRLLVFISGDGTLHVWGVKKDEVSTN
jgi:WD40 repeat protein